MRYIIMAGGHYSEWQTPRHLTEIFGEPVIARTIRLLRDAGVEDIAISGSSNHFMRFGVPVLHHRNEYTMDGAGTWADAFFPTAEPTCYLMGDVVFSPDAIKTIVKTETDGIQFFASAPPFHPRYVKRWAEPFAFKVVDQKRFRTAIDFVKANENTGIFYRRPIAWELWQVITGGKLNSIDYQSYIAINDYTCDIDAPGDAKEIERAMQKWT